MAAVKRSLNVGVIGMGHMGVPIVRNLAFKARSAFYLQIHSRSLSRARKVCDDLGADGATCAMRIHDRYRTMTKWCDIIICTLANPSASRNVLLEHEEAILNHARPGQIIVDHTTVDVALSRTCAAMAEQRGAVFLDAPISGSPRAAFNGQLVLMVGGPAESFQRLQPLFRMYADSIYHMGSSSAGTATKLLSQALVASHNAAAAEAMTMANRLGIEDQAKLIQVLDASWGASTMLRRNAPTMQDLIRNPDKIPPVSGASVEHLLNDLELLDASLAARSHTAQARDGKAADAAGRLTPITNQESATNSVDEEEEKFPVLDASLRMLGAAAEAGMGPQDMSAVIHYIQAAAEMEREERLATRRTSSPFATSTKVLPFMSSDEGKSVSTTNSTSISTGTTAPTSPTASTSAESHTNASTLQGEFTVEDFY